MIFLANELISLNEIKNLYPDLNNYLGNKYPRYNIDAKKEWISEYIYEYRISKIYSKATKIFRNLSLSNTEEKMYSWYINSNMKHQQDLINENSYDKLFVLDGVGIEYFEFILQCIISKGKKINYANYAKAYLPSITAINKQNINANNKWTTDFDKEIIHGKIFNKSKTLPDSLNFLKKTIKLL